MRSVDQFHISWHYNLLMPGDTPPGQSLSRYLNPGETLELSDQQIASFYTPIARRILATFTGATRALIAIAGPPGSGKSTFAAILAGVLDGISEKPVSAVVGLDGWHRTRAELNHFTSPEGGEPVNLLNLKGRPETFDALAALEWVRRARQGESCSYPRYNRLRHDPEPHSGCIDPSTRFILIEGNFLLVDLDPWRAFHSLFDMTMMLSAPRPVLIEALRSRHARGGYSTDEIERKLRDVDGWNIDWIEQRSIPADIVVTKSSPSEIVSVKFRSD